MGTRRSRFPRVDNRTREARLVRDVRAMLTNQIGSPTATQTQLIERAAQLTLHLARVDGRNAEMTERECRTYLSWSRELRQTLAQLRGAAARRTDRLPEKQVAA